MCCHLLAVLRGEFLQCLFGYGEHAVGAAGTVVEQVGAGFDLVRDRQEAQYWNTPHLYRVFAMD